MKRLPAYLILLLSMGLLVPSQAAGQLLAVGARASWNGGFETGTGNGVFGLGAQASVGIPLVGFSLQGTADLFFPDCGPEDCNLRDIGVNMLFSPPLPFLDPYLGAGLAFLHSGGALGEDSNVGLNLLAGLSVSHLFAEGKLQLVQNLDTQFVLTGGITIPLL